MIATAPRSAAERARPGANHAAHRPGTEAGIETLSVAEHTQASARPDADRKVKAVFKKMMPNHPMLRMTTDGLPTGRGLGSRRDGDGRRRLWG